MPTERKSTENLSKNLVTSNSKLFELLQDQFPIHPHPFLVLSEQLSSTESVILNKLQELVKLGILRKIGALVNHQMLGPRYSTLIAGKVPTHRLKGVVQVINRYPQVSHNYRRNHAFNLWFTLAERSQQDLEAVFGEIKELTKINSFINLPAIRRFKLDVRFNFSPGSKTAIKSNDSSKIKANLNLTDQDLRLIDALYTGLPLEHAPYRKIACTLKLTETKVVENITMLKSVGIIKRFGASFNHRKIGFQANGMSVWKVDSRRINEVAEILVKFREISHVYERQTIPDIWEYNLFGMIHALDPASCNKIAESIAKDTGIHDYAVLFSTEEFKKTRPPLFLDKLSEKDTSLN